MRVSTITRSVWFFGICAIAGAAVTAPSIAIDPTAFELRVGQSKTFSIKTTGGASTTGLVWQVVPSATSTTPDKTGALGTITSSGQYTAPAAVPATNPVYVRLADSKNATAATAAVTIDNPVPNITSLTPSYVNTGLGYQVDIVGTGFLSTSQVMWGTTPVTFKFVSATDLQIKGTSNAAANTTAAITVVNPGPGGATSNARTLTIKAPVQVTLSPDKRTIRCDATLQLGWQVQNNTDSAVTWTVNGTANGNASVGTVDAKGLYTAPAVLPNPPAVTIVATSVADPRATASITVNLENAMPMVTTVGITPGTTAAVKPVVTNTAGAVMMPTLPIGNDNITITGTGFAKGATVSVGGTSFPVTWVSPTSLTAAVVVAAAPGQVTSVKVTNPAPGGLTSTALTVGLTPPPCKTGATCLSYSDAVRFLEMATWGPTPASIAHLQSIPVSDWLNEQFTATPTPFPDPQTMNQGNGALQQAFLNNALTGNDQLLQRVTFALSEIFVVGGDKDNTYDAMVSYLRTLQANAFGSYRNLLGKVTLNPAMGKYLDMVNNRKADPKTGTAANENYAREVMQLFSIGTALLKSDGTPTVPPPNSLPTYSQDTVTQFAKVLTGWTYPPIPGYQSHWTNPAYYGGDMVSFDEYHDMTAKSVNFGAGDVCTIAPNQSALPELNEALDCLAKNSNVAPFISYRLIQRLVMSSPPSGYVSDITAVFNSTHGDLKAVVTAILTHPTALAVGSGKLREPVLYSTSLLRALNATVTGSLGSVATQTANMGQTLLIPPSVFSYFSPSYHIPDFMPSTVAPEFQELNAATALGRINFVYAVANNQIGGIKIDLQNWIDLAADTNALVNAINMALYRGQMTTQQMAAIQGAINASITTDPKTRVLNALYIAAAAPQYQIER